MSPTITDTKNMLQTVFPRTKVSDEHARLVMHYFIRAYELRNRVGFVPVTQPTEIGPLVERIELHDLPGGTKVIRMPSPASNEVARMPLPSSWGVGNEAARKASDTLWGAMGAGSVPTASGSNAVVWQIPTALADAIDNAGVAIDRAVEAHPTAPLSGLALMKALQDVSGMGPFQLVNWINDQLMESERQKITERLAATVSKIGGWFRGVRS